MSGCGQPDIGSATHSAQSSSQHMRFASKTEVSD
jgi:hypothetical protein